MVAVVNEVQRAKCPDSVENLNKIKICIFLNALFKLIALKANQPIANLTTNKILLYDIRDRFGSPDMATKKRTVYTVQKSYNYIMVLSALLSDKHELNLQTIRELASAATLSTLKKYASALCMKLNSATNTITIKLPSEKSLFPVDRMYSRNRK